MEACERGPRTTDSMHLCIGVNITRLQVYLKLSVKVDLLQNVNYMCGFHSVYTVQKINHMTSTKEGLLWTVSLRLLLFLIFYWQQMQKTQNGLRKERGLDWTGKV